MRRRGVLVRMSAVFMSCSGVFLSLFVTSMIVIVRRH